MFSCCDSYPVERSIIDRIEPCHLHGKPILYVCLNQQTCHDKPLFCNDCADIHRGHKWEGVQQFFTKEIQNLLAPDRSMAKSTEEQTIKEMLEEVAKFKARLEYRLIQLHNQIEGDYEKFQKKVSHSTEEPLVIGELNNETMGQLMNLIEREKKRSFINQLKQQVEEAIRITQDNINATLDSLKSTISGHDWQLLNRDDRQKMFNEFSSKHKVQAKYVKEKVSYRFSKVDKSDAISVSDACTEASYTNQAILKPTVSCNQIFTPIQNKLGFKILRLDKMAFFFDKSIIYIGACMVQIASSFNFTNLCQPSHGAYLIGSNGLSYHSKLPEYDRKTTGFQFGVGDVVEMWVDFKEGTLNFRKHKGPAKTTFSMKLGLNRKFLQKLTPCVMFSGEEGPIIRILNEDELAKLPK